MTYLADMDADNRLASLQAASYTYRIALGPRAGQKVLSQGTVSGRDRKTTADLCADAHGVSLHAGVRCGAHQRQELERLCHYITRLAIANERQLRRNPHVSYGSVAARRRRRWPLTAYRNEAVLQASERCVSVTADRSQFRSLAKWRRPAIPPGHGCRDEARASAACQRAQARKISPWQAAFRCARAKVRGAADARACRTCRSGLRQPCAGTALSRRDDHMRLNFSGHRAFPMPAYDRRRRAIRGERKQAGVARLDFAA